MISIKRFDDSSGNVWKYVFHFAQGAVAEAVLYRYGSFQRRTVICVSVQSGCPVGCTFCGTGNRFIRNLTQDEITLQVEHILADKQIDYATCDKFQIMFMSMGEPFLNYTNVESAIRMLHVDYPGADLLVSTIAPKSLSCFSDFIGLSVRIPNVGLQFSIHASADHLRDLLIPYKHKLQLHEIRNYGVQWWHETGRKPYLNYCITEGFSSRDIRRLKNIFPPNVFCLTFSVLCSSDETMKEAGYRNLDHIRTVEQSFQEYGYDTRIFDPAGQDEIGGGCGQLWYVQQFLKNKCNTK